MWASLGNTKKAHCPGHGGGAATAGTTKNKAKKGGKGMEKSRVKEARVENI